MSDKKANSTPSRIFKTIQDIYEFEEALLNSTLSEKDKKILQELRTGIPTFTTEEDRDRYLSDHMSDFHFDEQYILKSTGESISEKDPELKTLRKTGKVITAQEFIDQKMIQPFREGSQSEIQFSLDPIIFKAKGKTPVSIPYLKVSITTSLDTTSEAHHLLHKKTRTH